MIRQLIKEEITHFINEETEEQQRKTAIGQISDILSRLHHTNINAQDVLNASKDKYENEVAKQKPQDMSTADMSTADPLGEACGDMQSIAMGVDHDDKDHEGSMAKRQMFKTAMDSKAILDMIEDGQEFPAWIQSKMTKIADYIGSVKNYLEYEEVVGESTTRSVDEVYSEKQRRWACAQDDPKFDEMCADTAISKKKKRKKKKK